MCIHEEHSPSAGASAVPGRLDRQPLLGDFSQLVQSGDLVHVGSALRRRGYLSDASLHRGIQDAVRRRQNQESRAAWREKRWARRRAERRREPAGAGT
jgi:hypothetical protein